MFGQQKDYFSKQYRRRTLCTIALYYVTFLSAFRDDGDINMFAERQIPTLADYRPFAPHAQVISQNEMKIKWLPTSLNRMEFRAYYELYNDNDIEYVGQDLTHIAKRLHYGKEYKFKLRVCSLLVPADCSQFSMPRYQKLLDTRIEPSYQTLMQNQMKVFPMIALFAIFVIVSVFAGVILLSYLSNSLEGIPLDIHISRKPSRHKRDTTPFFIGVSCSTQDEKMNAVREDLKKSQQIIKKEQNEEKLTVKENTVEEKGAQTVIENDDWQTFVQQKRQRRRCKSYCSKYQNDLLGEWNLDFPVNTDVTTKNHDLAGGRETVVVVIDNSNIFIGARETVCNTNSQIKPKHVKLRLQHLLNIVENHREVSRGFTAGSTPPASEHVWEIYRKHGYTVDLEDRRGKDEQRVDELMHLSIYKALMELPAQTLILVTGDGNKGKSRGDTSFIGCAIKAIHLGWNVEIVSWKHSLSTEWCKLATRYLEKIKIIYLDKYVNILTQVERRTSKRKIEESKS